MRLTSWCCPWRYWIKNRCKSVARTAYQTWYTSLYQTMSRYSIYKNDNIIVSDCRMRWKRCKDHQLVSDTSTVFISSRTDLVCKFTFDSIMALWELKGVYERQEEEIAIPSSNLAYGHWQPLPNYRLLHNHWLMTGGSPKYIQCNYRFVLRQIASIQVAVMCADFSICGHIKELILGFLTHSTVNPFGW